MNRRDIFFLISLSAILLLGACTRTINTETDDEVCSSPEDTTCTVENNNEQEGQGNPDAVFCTEEDKEIKGCTKEYNPVCGNNEETYGNPCVACQSQEIDWYTLGGCEGPKIGNPMASCESIGGTWIEDVKECEGISEEQCKRLGGTFHECASACRNDPNAEICTLQCVLVCEL